MTRRLRSLAVPAYLLVCLLAGGSSRGVWSNAALQLLAVLLIAWAAISPRPEPLSRPSRLLLLLALACPVVAILQLMPLPPAIWSSLPGREAVAAGYQLLGYPLPWLPLSWAPYDTLSTSYVMLPPLAIVAGIFAMRAHRESWLAGAIVVGAMASVLLGALQVASGGRASWAYFYEITNTGAVGFFANRNHMATLLLSAIPFAAAIFASGDSRIKGRGAGFAKLALGGGGFLLLILGLLLNSSLAALALAVPVIAVSAVILPAGWKLRRALVPLALVALSVAVVAMSSSSVRNFGQQSDLGAFTSRTEMWDNTVRAIGETFPVGTGLGTFSQIYALGENSAVTRATYINHAHNDYLELVLETGAVGLLLILALLAWWAWQTLRVWRSPSSTAYARAATVASAAILAHSIVDFPLRTTAVAALFAASLATMAQPPRQRRSERAKHVDIA